MQRNQGIGGNPGQNPNYQECCQMCWSQTPFFCRITIYCQLLTFISSYLLPGVISLLINCPYFVFEFFALWSLITSPFVCFSFMSLLFGLLWYWPYAMQKERQMGTIKYMAFFLLNNLIINVIYIVISFILFELGKPYTLFAPLYGLWPIIMINLVIQCNKDPEVPRRLCFFPCQIPSKYFPWLILLMFVLLGSDQNFGILIGFIVGYLHVYKKLNWTIISDQLAQSYETQNLLNYETFVSVQNASGEDENFNPFSFGMPQQQQQRNPSQGNAMAQQQSMPAPGIPQTSAFSGQGQVLGGPSQGRSKLIDMYSNEKKVPEGDSLESV